MYIIIYYVKKHVCVCVLEWVGGNAIHIVYKCQILSAVWLLWNVRVNATVQHIHTQGELSYQ